VCVSAATDSKTKKPSKKQLLAEQKRREKVLALVYNVNYSYVTK